VPIKKVVDGIVHWLVHLVSLYAAISILGLQDQFLIALLATFLVDIDHIGVRLEHLLDLNVAKRFLLHNVITIFLAFLGSLLRNLTLQAISLGVLTHLTWDFIDDQLRGLSYKHWT